jgi:hypothetical protein
MIAQEQEFDDKLKRIGDLYEEGKDCLANIMPMTDRDEVRHHSRVYEILRELRDIAAINLKSNHEIKDN